MSAAPSEDPTLEPPEWILCRNCDKWRKLPTEYVVAVQYGAWSCSEPGSGCSCAEACHGCSRDPCTCESSGCWQDPTDPNKYAFAFGADVPKGFSQHVKQKPAGGMYVEYSVYCLRCDAHGTLDRSIETLRAKERLLVSGRGGRRTLECWLRDHRGCNADWSNLTPNSLSFKVPLGYRRYRSTKSPLYTPAAQASSASSQPATSDLTTADTSSPQFSACLAQPAHSDSAMLPTSGPRIAHGSPPQHMEQMPSPSSNEQIPVTPSEAQAELEIPTSSHMFGNASTTPFRLDKAVAGSSPAVAAQDFQANTPENPAAATADVKVAKPAVQSAAMFISGPSQGEALLHCKIFRPPFAQTTGQCTTAGGNGKDSATCAAGSQHLDSPALANAATPKQDATPSDLRQAVHPSVSATDDSVKAEPGQTAKAHTVSLPSIENTGVLAAPRGLNGPLLSKPQKRKAALSLKPQAEPVDLTLSDDDSADKVSGNAKRIKAELQEHVHAHTDHADSLAFMVQELNNRDLQEKPISKEQLQNLQDAVDGVTELKILQPQELTHVLTSVGKLEPVQKIFVRRFLNMGSSLG